VVDPVTPEAVKTGPAVAGQPLLLKFAVVPPVRLMLAAISLVQVEVLPELPEKDMSVVGA